ncbi:MAG: response regulator [bacterium]
MSPSSNRTPRRRILVVEDDALQARLLCRILERLEYEAVGPAGSIEDALSYARVAPIDGGVLDINVREQSSLPVAEVLRERKIPFLFLTGYGSGEIPAGLGRVVRLAKPVEPYRLGTALASFFRDS